MGSEAFRKTVSDTLNEPSTIRRLEGDDLAEFNAARWETYLNKCLGRLRKTLKNAKTEKRSADWKLAVASKLKRETSVTNAWLTSHLHMGTPRSVSAICGVYQKEKTQSCKQAKKLKNLIIVR